MKQLTFTQTVPLVQEEDGTVRVTGSRVTLDTLVGAFQKGATAEQIQDSFPSLSLQRIYATIACYLEHQTEVDSYLKLRQEDAALTRNEIESHQDTEGFRARIRTRRAQLFKA
ncbi:MAG: DUF433 domain-containing protein [Pyrinomonadaceae bacterium]